MFKKLVEAKTHQRLSGADRKKLKRTIRDRFPNASDAHIDILIPPKVEITVAKYPNRVLVYGIENDVPIFFDVDGRGSQIFPSVYALWKVPELLPAFVLKGGEVSHYIIGGADLMYPGISIPPEGLPSHSAGEPWAVKVPGNQAPIAVGTTTMSSSEAVKAGLRGKALKICHYYRDLLWESAEKCYIPNGGFLDDVVLEDPSISFGGQGASSNEGEASITEESGTNNDIGVVAGVQDDLVSDSNIVENVLDEQVIADVQDLKLTEDGGQSNADGEQRVTLSVEEVDTLLDKCLLQALHTTVKDKDLPMPGSTLWSNHVLPCRPEGITLDIKKSSYKKLSKWLQSKSSLGLISVKEDKHKKETTLVGVNRKHADYTSFKPEKRKAEKMEQVTNPTASEGRVILEVEEIYKPSVHVNPIFASVGADTGKLFSASEATDIVFQYIEKENLVKPTNKSIVVLDAILCDALFKGTVKKGGTYPTEIHKKDLGSTFVNRMQAHHRVTRGTESAVRKGGLKTIQILTERRQGNKKVTKFSGFESFLIHADALASELQKKFACSTSVAELPGKKGHEVLVQGGVIDDLAKHLVQQYGIPKKYIEVLDKTKR
ncbi:hypothetical protein DCAR_0103717 [Daucus carota subsp. sativus]|uniref:SUI1 domain-containing protein n=1 Tax=Daucus carota subsp. sativus TaxID=79200 RepID=A0AAF0WAF6_DAUCS|nr:hypothetical protein DCAR_0103717 [Daucus carota subsp. sativus]